MHKRKNTKSIFQNNGKFSPATSFDFITPVKKKKHANLNNPAPAGVLTFAFQPFSIIELLGSLYGGLI
ncbi:MAG: hypothetical protein K2Q21_03320 [Chitinophagaceae bacterium]|nr:hypothetical protein [Chitinophagaceae bacterium]